MLTRNQIVGEEMDDIRSVYDRDESLLQNFFIIRPTRCTNMANLFLAWNSTCFGRCLCQSSGVHSLYTQQCYMSYRFVDSFREGPGWNCSSILICS